MKRKQTKYKNKYTMYIIDFSEWITYFNFERQISDGYCFETGQWDNEKNMPVKPYKLNIEEAIWCIVDCVSIYNGYRFKIYPEKEFLIEFDKYKNDVHNNRNFEFWKLNANIIDFDNILNTPKKEQVVEFVKINRNTFIDYDKKVRKNGLYTYYNLTCDGVEDFQPQSKLISNCALKPRPDYSYEFERRNRYWTASTPIVSIKRLDKEYVFETIRSIYKTKNVIESENVNTIDELKNYLKSDDFNRFMKAWKKEEMRFAK